MGTWGWIVLGVLAVLLLSSSGKQKTKPESETGKSSKRIDHLHYIDPDEYECPKCGARFRENAMACPECGEKFSGKTEDEDEFIEEMELWNNDDE